MSSTLMLLSNPHRPDPRVLLEGRMLLEAAIGVTLIAWGREDGWAKHSEEAGIRVIRAGPLCPTRSPMKVFSRLPRFWWNALNESKKLEFDLVHAHDFDTLPLGLAISSLSGRPLLYDAHELYAKMIESEAGPLSKLVWIWERRCVRRADEVITVSDSLANELSIGRRTRARVVTTSQDPSGAIRTDSRETREKYGLTGFVVSYLGALEPGRFVEEFISSFSPGEKVSLMIAGSGTLEPLVAKASLHDSAVRFVGRVDVDEALRITRASDLVLAMMDPSNPNNVVGTPGKIINALAVGRPVITTEGLQIGDRISKVGAGIVVPYNRAAFRDAVLRAMGDQRGLAEMGKKGRALYEKEFSWEKSREGLLKAYSALLGRSRAETRKQVLYTR